MNTPTLIASAPTEIVAGLVILLSLASLILFVLSTEDGIRRFAADTARRLCGRRRWLCIPGAGQTLAQGGRHDYAV
jgi:hypothetical protein